MITIYNNALGVSMDMAKTAKRVGPMMRSVVEQNGKDLHELVLKFASGYQGGPEVRTGRYKSSIQKKDMSRGPFNLGVEVGTDEPYGMKLEMGGAVGAGMFGGEDDFHIIAPHPHFGPAMQIMEPKFIRSLMDTIVVLPIGRKGVVG